MLRLNKLHEQKQSTHDSTVGNLKARIKQLENQLEQQKQEYEALISSANQDTFEDKLSTARHFHKQIEMLQTELEVSMQIRKALIDKNFGLMEEISVLQGVVQTKRSHFKEIEKADFANLEQ